MTRFISHAIFDKVIAEARKRHITIFNVMGTGILKRQVRELLELRRDKIPEVFSTPVHAHSVVVHDLLPTPVSYPSPTTVSTTTEPKVNTTMQQGKLKPLYDMIDYSGTRTNADMAREMFAKAKELGIDTTLLSIIQLVNVKIRTYKKNRLGQTPKQVVENSKKVEKKDSVDKTNIVVQMLDNMVRELKDMRDYVKATEEENRTLKLRVEKLKKALSDD